MRPPGGERNRQRLARRQQVPLPDDVANGVRAQALGQRDAGGRDGGGGEEIGHGRGGGAGRWTATDTLHHSE